MAHRFLNDIDSKVHWFFWSKNLWYTMWSHSTQPVAKYKKFDFFYFIFFKKWIPPPPLILAAMLSGSPMVLVMGQTNGSSKAFHRAVIDHKQQKPLHSGPDALKGNFWFWYFSGFFFFPSFFEIDVTGTEPRRSQRRVAFKIKETWEEIN